MNIRADSYSRSNLAGSEQNRQVVLLMLLSKLALALLIGMIYAGLRFIG